MLGSRSAQWAARPKKRVQLFLIHFKTPIKRRNRHGITLLIRYAFIWDFSQQKSDLPSPKKKSRPIVWPRIVFSPSPKLYEKWRNHQFQVQIFTVNELNRGYNLQCDLSRHANHHNRSSRSTISQKTFEQAYIIGPIYLLNSVEQFRSGLPAIYYE